MKRILKICLFIFASQIHAQKSDFNEINFQKADSTALACKNEKLDNLPELSFKLTAHLPTEVEKFRAIYMWICANIANDYGQYSKNMRKRHRFKNDSLKLQEWNDRFRQVSFKKLLKDHKTICTGYAYLLKKLSELSNIECEIVNGYARTSTINIETLTVPNHSWNAVKFDDKWYLCDPTWASGIPNPTTNFFEFEYNDGFFLTDPELFATNHYPEKTRWLLLNGTEHTFQNFLDAPVVYNQAYKHKIIYDEPKNMHNIIQKNEMVTFKYKLLKPADVKDINMLVDNGSDSKLSHPESIVIDGLNLSIVSKFESSGFYDVHILIGKDLITTYTFRVKS